VVEGARLEIVCTARYRGFESLPLRHSHFNQCFQGFREFRLLKNPESITVEHNFSARVCAVFYACPCLISADKTISPPAARTQKSRPCGRPYLDSISPTFYFRRFAFCLHDLEQNPCRWFAFLNPSPHIGQTAERRLSRSALETSVRRSCRMAVSFPALMKP